MYVNNKDFNQAIIEFHERKKDNSKEKIPDNIVRMLIAMANKLATRYNFNGYSYKDEFIQDGILRCIEIFHNFDPEKSKNPFSYFTTVLFNSFVQRIKKEKKERVMRDTLIMTQEIYHLDEGDEKMMINKDIVIGDYQFDSMGE